MSGKPDLIKRIERKLRIRAFLDLKIAHFWLPGIIWLQQYGVLVFSFEALQMFQKTVNITAGTGPADAGVDDDVFARGNLRHYRYNYRVKTLKQLPYYGLMALLVYMPFHIFLSQSLSLATGGLSVWKVAKDIILFGFVMVALGVVWWQRLKNNDLKKLTVLTAAYGAVHLFAWAINPHIFHTTAFEGVVYNNRVLFYSVLGLAAVLLKAKSVTEQELIKLTLTVSTIVCVLGVLQYFLPKDILAHVGYSIPRGVKPNFFIDDKPDFPRIMSTLRDPNSLGAFVIVPLTLLYGLFLKFRLDAAKRNKTILLTLLHTTALFLTFSRGAWVGAFVALVGCFIFVRTGELRISKKTLMIAGCIVVLLGGFIIGFRHQRIVENVIRHSDQSTKASQDSNALHLDFAAQSLKASFKKPLGHGPGTAGIVSIRNPKGGQLTENYYIQLLYEVGLLGLAIFVTSLVFIMSRLQKTRTLLGNALFASMLAYALMGVLMHIWSNEAVAAQWWLLAGAALGLGFTSRNKRRLAVDK